MTETMTPEVSVADLITFDLETWLIEPGLLTPPIVCGAFARELDSSLYLRDEALDLIEQLLADPDCVTARVGGANIFYDLGCVAAARPHLVPAIFAAVATGRVVDTHIAEVLHDIALGIAYKDGPREFKRYSLNLLERRHLGLDRVEDKVGPDAWRLRYRELDGVPLEEWPEKARQYVLDDAVGARLVLERQLRAETRVPREHDWSFAGGCMHCGAPEGGAAPCPDFVLKRHNLHVLQQEISAAWWLHLSAIWGVRTDAAMVEVVTADWQRQHEENRRRFFASGIVRVDTCNRDQEPDDISDAWLEEQDAALLLRADFTEDWVGRRLVDIAKCKRARAKNPSRGLRFATDTKLLKELTDAAYRGTPPTTEGGDVSTSRDTLEESGDELLEAFGEAGPVEKERSTFAGILRQGTAVPINPSISYVKVTQRMSYSEPNLGQLPRKGRTRECFVPRPGWLYCSLDYSGVELCTLAQICYTLFGHSAMRDALNLKQDLHSRLAARMLSITYEEAVALKKAKNLPARDPAKNVNFGCGGMMGPPKMVLTARKAGVYFCESAGHGPCRGHPRVLEYASLKMKRAGMRPYPIPPTCAIFLDLAEQYRGMWYEEWPETVPYHELIKQLADMGDAGEPLESFGTGMLRLESSPTAAANHFFQNLAAQSLKAAGGLVSRESYCDTSSVLYNNLRIVGAIHDELLCEVREEVATEASWRAAALMKDGIRPFVPDVDVQVEPALMRRWFKGAEKVERGGKLVPWWPETPCRKCRGLPQEECTCWTWAPDQEAMLRDAA